MQIYVNFCYSKFERFFLRKKKKNTETAKHSVEAYNRIVSGGMKIPRLWNLNERLRTQSNSLRGNKFLHVEKYIRTSVRHRSKVKRSLYFRASAAFLFYSFEKFQVLSNRIFFLRNAIHEFPSKWKFIKTGFNRSTFGVQKADTGKLQILMLRIPIQVYILRDATSSTDIIFASNLHRHWIFSRRPRPRNDPHAKN